MQFRTSVDVTVMYFGKRRQFILRASGGKTRQFVIVSRVNFVHSVNRRTHVRRNGHGSAVLRCIPSRIARFRVAI